MYIISGFQGCVIDFADLDLPFNSEVVTVSTVNHMFGIFYDDVSIQYKLDNVLIFIYSISWTMF
jgi:hypothetical protein